MDGTTNETTTADAGGDAALLAECERFLAAEAECRALLDADLEEDGTSADAARRHAADLLASMRPVTSAGLRAMARVDHAFCQPDPPAPHDLAGPMLWTVITTLAEAEVQS